MRHNLSKHSQIFVWLLPISFLVSSCHSNFKSVENFANGKTAIQTSSDILAQDIYDSCLRRANYIDLLLENGIEAREERIKECNSINKPNVKNVQSANKVLLDYMTSLGQVASGTTVTFDTNINALGTALKAVSINNVKLPAATIQNGTNILSILVNVLTTSKRSKAVKKAILCSDDSLHRYITGNPVSDTEEPDPTGGLIELAQDGYLSDMTGILGLEKTDLNGYYKTYFPALRKSNESQIAGVLEAQKDYNKAIEIIQQKSDNAQKYIDILKATAKTHHDLRNEFQGKGKNAISKEEFDELCKSALAGNVSNLERSNHSEKLNLTEQQLDKAKVILAKYAQKVENLQNNIK